MIKHITFVRPALGIGNSADAMTPLVFALLRAATPPEIEAKLIDERVEPLSIVPTDLVAISVETFTARRAYEIAALYRAQGVPVVMGGQQPTLLPEEALEHCDSVVIGDAEGQWEQLISDACQGKLKKRYENGFRDARHDGVRFDRSIFEGKKYAPVQLVQVGSGCRYACEFCSIHAFYGESRAQRPAHEVAAEIRTLPPGRLIFFVDDNLLWRRDRFVELMKALTPLNRMWSCQISIDIARDDALLDLMKEAGCRLVLIGLESLNRDNLRRMHKNWNHVAGEYEEVVEKLHARGIMLYGTFIFGYDNDCYVDFLKTAEFAKRNGFTIANFNPLTPYPGTELYKRLEAAGELLRPRWWVDPDFRYGDPIVNPKNMTPHDLTQGPMDARRIFYGWGSIIRRAISGLYRWRRPKNVLILLMSNIISRREISRKQARPLSSSRVSSSRASS
jgi:radical SAM superfamily enzyme YgiQ (UPF0313 family)